MQHIVVRSAKPANLKAEDWQVNGVGRNGTPYSKSDMIALLILFKKNKRGTQKSDRFWKRKDVWWNHVGAVGLPCFFALLPVWEDELGLTVPYFVESWWS